MNNIKTNWEDIGISNDFLFGKVMRNLDICKELLQIILPDLSIERIEFLNTRGRMDDVSEDLKAFLDYVEGKPSDNSFIKKLEDEVREAKKNREWRHEYMTLLMRDQENQKAGETRGEERLSKLIKMLINDNRISDIEKVTDDKEYRHKLYKEYHIS